MWQAVRPVLVWVLPVLLGALLFVPLVCGGGIGDCAVGMDCGPSETRVCVSSLGVPTNGAMAIVGIPAAVLVAAAYRKVRKQRRRSGQDV